MKYIWNLEMLHLKLSHFIKNIPNLMILFHSSVVYIVTLFNRMYM